VQGLAQQDYPASNIFISFETESAQRKVLNEMSVGTIAAWRNKQSAVQPHCLFRNEHVLNVNEPDEPSTVRWQDLNVRFFARLKQLLYTTAATVAAIILIALIIRLVNDKKAAYAAIVIAIFNSLFPMCGKWLTSLESHASEGSKQVRPAYCPGHSAEICYMLTLSFPARCSDLFVFQNRRVPLVRPGNRPYHSAEMYANFVVSRTSQGQYRHCYYSYNPIY
jgi:hypothetical protein